MGGMKIMTINVPEPYLDVVAILCENGFYQSRSEALRVAIKRFLSNEEEFLKQLESSKVDLTDYLENVFKIRNKK